MIGIKIETFVEPNYIGRMMWRIEGRVHDEHMLAECPVEESDKIKLSIIKNIVEKMETLV